MSEKHIWTHVRARAKRASADLSLAQEVAVAVIVTIVSATLIRGDEWIQNYLIPVGIGLVAGLLWMMARFVWNFVITVPIEIENERDALYVRNGETKIQDWSKEWKELSDRFDKSDLYVKAEIQRGGFHVNGDRVGEQWRICKGSTQMGTDLVESLCAYGGSLLLRSPSVGARLSENVRQQKEHHLRWLYFLKEHHAAVKYDENHGVSWHEGKKETVIYGVIGSIAAISKSVCILCASEEH